MRRPVTVRRGDRSSATVSAEYNGVELPEGDFTTFLTSLRLGHFFTPHLHVQGLIQYSDQIDRWSTNLRLGWLDTAGTGLFIVYNDVQGFDTPRGSQARSLIVKYTRQFDLFGM